MMDSTVVITLLVGLIAILLFVGAPMKPTRFMAHSLVKISIGVLLLFFFNVFGGLIGLHIPINFFTIIITGFLGIFGLASLTAIHIFII